MWPAFLEMPCRARRWDNLQIDWCRFPVATAITLLDIPGYRICGGFAAPAWFAAESLSQVLPLQPDKQLAAADVQLLSALILSYDVIIYAYSLMLYEDFKVINVLIILNESHAT